MPLVRLLSNPRPELVRAATRKSWPKRQVSGEATPSRRVTKFDDAQRNHVVHLFEQGWTLRHIATTMGCHSQTAREVLLAQGCEVARHASALSPEKEAEICRLRSEGLTYPQIAQQVGISPGIVRRTTKLRNVQKGTQWPVLESS